MSLRFSIAAAGLGEARWAEMGMRFPLSPLNSDWIREEVCVMGWGTTFAKMEDKMTPVLQLHGNDLKYYCFSYILIITQLQNNYFTNDTDLDNNKAAPEGKYGRKEELGE